MFTMRERNFKLYAKFKVINNAIIYLIKVIHFSTKCISVILYIFLIFLEAYLLYNVYCLCLPMHLQYSVIYSNTKCNVNIPKYDDNQILRNIPIFLSARYVWLSIILICILIRIKSTMQCFQFKTFIVCYKLISYLKYK